MLNKNCGDLLKILKNNPSEALCSIISLKSFMWKHRKSPLWNKMSNLPHLWPNINVFSFLLFIYWCSEFYFDLSNKKKTSLTEIPRLVIYQKLDTAIQHFYYKLRCGKTCFILRETMLKILLLWDWFNQFTRMLNLAGKCLI